jgi:hypothetical protein
VEEAGIDTGYAPRPTALYAPDVSVGNVPDRPGWVPGVPLLALEYASTGQDEDALATKIADLLDSGTRVVWVARLSPQRFVEVHVPGEAPKVVDYDGELSAPGILKNTIAVRALFEREVADAQTLKNLLQRRGYESFEAVVAEGRKAGIDEGRKAGIDEGREAGLREALAVLLVKRFGALDAVVVARLDAADATALRCWAQRVLDATSIETVFDGTDAEDF